MRVYPELGKAKIYTSIDLAWAFWQIPVRKADRQKTASLVNLGYLSGGVCLLVCVTHQQHSTGNSASATRIVNREGSMVMAYIR